MSFAVLRAAKLGAGGVGAATNHNENRLDLPNADSELSYLNKSLVGTGNIWEDVQNRITQADIKPRKNACLAIEFVVTASPEFYKIKKGDSVNNPGTKTLIGNYKTMAAYEQTALNWFRKTYGEENVVSVNRHMDEKTPHLHIFVVPILKKEISLTRQRKGQPVKQRRSEQRLVLSATDVMGGPKEMADMQTNFAAAVQHLGLSRGIAGTGAKHTTTKQYSALTAAAVKGENVEMVQKTLDLLGNRRDRIEQSELQAMKKAMAAQGLTFYKGQFMATEDAQRAQEAEKLARITRKEETPAKELKTSQKPPKEAPVQKSTGYKPKR